MNQSPLARAAAAQPVRVDESVIALTTSAAAPRSALPVGMQPDMTASSSTNVPLELFQGIITSGDSDSIAE